MNPSHASETEISNPTSAYPATRLEETDAVFCSNWDQLRSTAVRRSRISGMDTKVFKAAREGDIYALREHSGQLHQMLTPSKNTVLHVYIACVGSARLAKSEVLKSAEVVKEMIEMCQQLLLQPNESGDTALHLAARHGRADIVEALIQAAKDWHGDLEEGFSSREERYQCLIRRTNKEKNTALHETVRFDRHLDVVKILTREDPEFLYSANAAGETPIYIAAEKGYSDLVLEIIDTCTSPSCQGPRGLTALHIAAIYGHKQIARKLLEKEMMLATAADVRGFTPLHMAAFGGHASIVKQILECDSSAAYIGDNQKTTAAHFAALRGCIDVMKQLMFYCPDSFELADNKGRSVLHYAIYGNEDEVVKFVREDPWLSSFLLNGKDYEGNTPLHLVAISGKNDGLEFISDRRVDKMTFNNNNNNALDIIRKIRTDSQWKTNLEQGLRNAGARSGQRVSKDGGDGKEVDVISQVDRELKYKEIKESHLVVSTLIATVTFAAGFTVPGGYQNEKGPDQGFAVLSRSTAFKAFVITNTLALTMSICAVMLRFFSSLKGQQSLSTPINCTVWALIAMMVAFLSGLYAVLGAHSSLGLAVAACVIGSVFFSVTSFVSISPAFMTFRKRVCHLHSRIVARLGLEYYFIY